MDLAVRSRLAHSLGALYERAASLISRDDGALKTLLAEIERGPVRPAAFGLYTEFVESLCADQMDVAQALSDELLSLDVACAGTRIVTLSDLDLGPGQAERYARLVDDDPDKCFLIQQVRDKASLAKAVRDALSLIEAGAPDLAEDIKALAREIVVAEPAEGPEDGIIRRFDGASTLYLWGAVFIDPAGKSRIDLAQTLAHETGHLLLFGLTAGHPLVENDEDEHYASPLRQDPRPMEGVVHAAYVVARMHYALASLLRSDVLASDERQDACDQMAGHERCFFDGLQTIERHARFTPDGRTIFQDAVTYMSAEAHSKQSALS